MTTALTKPRRSPHTRRAFTVLVIFGLLCSCAKSPIAESDQLYYPWDDRRVLCAAEIADETIEDIDAGLARASADQTVLLLYGHKPGRDFAISFLEQVLQAAEAHGVPLLNFEDLLTEGASGAGFALSFDDAFITEWYSLRTLFQDYDARVTFFVTRYDRLDTQDLAMLSDLQADGHTITSHGLRHRDAPLYSENHGLRAWVDDELLPSLTLMTEAGFSQAAFAYPYGARTPELDRATLEHVSLVRSLSFLLGAPISDPCPY